MLLQIVALAGVSIKEPVSAREFRQSLSARCDFGHMEIRYDKVKSQFLIDGGVVQQRSPTDHVVIQRKLRELALVHTDCVEESNDYRVSGVSLDGQLWRFYVSQKAGQARLSYEPSGRD